MVSVLMITRNHGSYIAQAIESVLEQHFDGGLELLVGEDGSTDNTGLICTQYAERYPKSLRVLRSPEGPMGMHANFLRLFEQARGKYLAFLEGDDYWTDQQKLRNQVQWLEQDSNLSLCGTRTAVIEQSADGVWQVVREVRPPHRQLRYRFEEMIPHYNFHFSSVLVRRSALELPPWVAEQYCIDRPLYLLATRNGDAAFIDRVTSVYRQHKGGVWSESNLSYKAQSSRTLFHAFMSNFPAEYRPAFQRALSGILWYYLSMARQSRERLAGREIFRLSLASAPVHRLISSPVRVVSMAVWLWVPWLDGLLRRLLGKST